MTRLDILNKRVGALPEKLLTYVRQSLEKKETDIIDLQRTQLFGGIDSNGEDIRPLYTEDLKANGGYFKSVDAARQYAEWKGGMTYPKDVYRNPLAPNLYIANVPNEGKFHSELGVEFSDDAMAIVGTTNYAKMIMAKYGNETFGLTDESFETIREEVKDSIIEQIKGFING